MLLLVKYFYPHFQILIQKLVYESFHLTVSINKWGVLKEIGETNFKT